MGKCEAQRLPVRVVILTLALALAGCTAGHDSATSSPPPGMTPSSSTPGLHPLANTAGWTTPSAGPLKLTTPQTWRFATYPWASSRASSIAYLSTERMHDPRKREPLPGGGLRTSVGFPIAHLGHDGVLIIWTQVGGLPGVPGSDPLGPQGVRLTVDGHRARLVDEPATSECAALGGTRSVEGRILDFEVLTMWACLADASDKTASLAETAFRLTAVHHPPPSLKPRAG